jgi:hypothetical protein
MDREYRLDVNENGGKGLQNESVRPGGIPISWFER